MLVWVVSTRKIVSFRNGMKKSLSFCTAMCTSMKGKNSHIFFMASVSGFLALFWSCLGSKDWNFGVPSCGGFPSLSVAYNVFVFMSLWVLGFRVWYLGFRFEEVDKFLWLIPKMSMNKLCNNCVVCAACGAKIESWKKNSPPERLKRSKEQNTDDLEEDDVLMMKEKLAEERKLRHATVAQLEEERAAASSAAREAMAKIACLQNEMGLIQREARLSQEMAEQKKLHDQQVIETLHWIIMKLEAEKKASCAPEEI